MCVKHAMEHGNHAAFIHYMIQYAGFPKERFVEQFELLIDQWKEQYGTRENQLKLLKDDYWRSPGFCCTLDDLHMHAYKPGMLSGWKSRSSQSIPAKNVIVQLGLHLLEKYVDIVTALVYNHIIKTAENPDIRWGYKCRSGRGKS